MANTANLAYQSIGSGHTAFTALDELRRLLVAIGLALAPAGALASAALPEQRGHPGGEVKAGTISARWAKTLS